MTIHTSVTEIDSNQWNDLVKKSLTSSFFQTPECYDFYASLSFLDPFVFAVSENDRLAGLICGYIVAERGRWKHFFSRRAIVPGGALLHPGISDSALEKLLKYTANSLKKKAIYLEFRNYSNFSSFRPLFERIGCEYQPHLNFRVPAVDEDAAFRQLSKTKRKHIRNSQRNGAEIIELQNSNDIKSFYNLLSGLYEAKVKKPLFPIEFFEKIVKMPGCRLFGIKYQGELIGGNLCVFLKNKAVYDWYICGLDEEYKDLHPSTMATWAGIKYAAGNDFPYFDMMGAGKPDEGYGVREFKAKFGGILVEHGRFLFVTKPILYAFGKKMIHFSKWISR